MPVESSFLGSLSQMAIKRPASWNGRGRRSTASKMLNTAVFAGGRPERVREVEPQSIEAPGRPLVPALVVDLPDAAELEPRLPARFRGVHAPWRRNCATSPRNGSVVRRQAGAPRVLFPIRNPSSARALLTRSSASPSRWHRRVQAAAFNLELLPPLSRQRVKFGFPAAFLSRHPALNHFFCSMR